MSEPLVTVVTPTTGDPSVLRAIQSVADQTYGAIQHLVVIDNPHAPAEIKTAIRAHNVDVIENYPMRPGKIDSLVIASLERRLFSAEVNISVFSMRIIGSTAPMSRLCST